MPSTAIQTLPMTFYDSLDGGREASPAEFANHRCEVDRRHERRSRSASGRIVGRLVRIADAAQEVVQGVRAFAKSAKPRVLDAIERAARPLLAAIDDARREREWRAAAANRREYTKAYKPKRRASQAAQDAEFALACRWGRKWVARWKHEASVLRAWPAWKPGRRGQAWEVEHAAEDVRAHVRAFGVAATRAGGRTYRVDADGGIVEGSAWRATPGRSGEVASR